MSKQRKRNTTKDQIPSSVVEAAKKIKEATIHNKSTPQKQKKADFIQSDNK